jgi:S1-C subfamily serine protease
LEAALAKDVLLVWPSVFCNRQSVIRPKSAVLSSFLIAKLLLSFDSLNTASGADQSENKRQTREEKQKAAEEKKAAQRKAEEERKQAEEDHKQKQEQEKIIKKYAKFSTAQLQVKVASLTQQVAGGYYGQGLGFVIAKGIWDGKVKERDEIALEIVRRRDIGEARPPAGLSDGKLQSSGTGFLITDDGYLVTNHHVVKHGQSVKVRTAQGESPATLVASDPAIDLALLKLDGHFSPLPVKSSRSVRLGETIATVGFPNPGLQGFSPKLTKGEISSLAGIQDDPKQFQVSLPVQPGNSGGALVDATGNVVGVVVARLNQSAALATTGALAENVNYAIKASFLLSFLESSPGVAAKLAEPRSDSRPFEDVVAEVEKATVLILVY